MRRDRHVAEHGLHAAIEAAHGQARYRRRIAVQGHRRESVVLEFQSIGEGAVDPRGRRQVIAHLALDLMRAIAGWERIGRNHLRARGEGIRRRQLVASAAGGAAADATNQRSAEARERVGRVEREGVIGETRVHVAE